MIKLLIFTILFVSCAHKKETLTQPIEFKNSSGQDTIQEMGEEYFENIVFMFSVELELQGYFEKALEGYLFLYNIYPKDAFLLYKITNIECQFRYDCSKSSLKK